MINYAFFHMASRAPNSLVLKIGAQMMATFEVNSKIVTGSRGVIAEFDVSVVLKELSQSSMPLKRNAMC